MSDDAGSGLRILPRASAGAATSLIEVARAGVIDGPEFAAAIDAYDSGSMKFDRMVNDRSAQTLSFNVMPGREVVEELQPRYFLVGKRCARAVFDRAYRSAMEKSPSHLIFLSAIAQWQKLIYLTMCHEHDVHYRPHDKEAFKIWPTDIRIVIPSLLRAENELRQDSVLSKVDPLAAGKWSIEGFSIVNSRLGLVGRASVYRIE